MSIDLCATASFNEMQVAFILLGVHSPDSKLVEEEVYVYIYVYMHVCMCVCLSLSVCLSVRPSVGRSVWLGRSAGSCCPSCRHVGMLRTCKHTYIHAYIHTYIHAHSN